MPEGGVIRESRPRSRHKPRTLLMLDIDVHIAPTTREWVTIDGSQCAMQAFGSEERLAATLGSLSDALFSQEKTEPHGELETNT